MGFLDKLAKSVQQLSEQLEATGIVDEVTAAVKSATGAEPSTASASEGPLTGTSEEIVAAAVTRGAFDAGGLITTDEVSEILGARVTAPTCFHDELWIGWNWSAADASGPPVEVNVWVAFSVTDGTQYDAHDFWNGYLKGGEAGDGSEPVRDLGEDAFRKLDAVYCVVNADIFFAWGSDKAEDILRRILENFYKTLV